jgi:Fe-S-cluster containining protein
VEDCQWYLNVKNKCRHLSEKDYKYQIYDKRPRICRQYSLEKCDFTVGQYDYDLYFEDDRQMEAYTGVKFPQKAAKKFSRS